MLRYRLAISASVVVAVGLNFEGCGNDDGGDSQTPSPTAAGGGTPAPTPTEAPTPSPVVPTPAPTPPYDPSRWNCKEWDAAIGNGCGTLSEAECEVASVVALPNETVSGRSESACWNDHQGAKVHRHGRDNSCTVRYCWYFTSQEGCEQVEDCVWDEDYEPTKYDNPNHRQHGSKCYSCSMQGKKTVTDLPGNCPNSTKYPNINTDFYKEMVGYVWRTCGLDGKDVAMPEFEGMDFDMLNGVSFGADELETDPTGATEAIMTDADDVEEPETAEPARIAASPRSTPRTALQPDTQVVDETAQFNKLGQRVYQV